MNKHEFTQKSEQLNSDIRKLKIGQLEETKKQESIKLKTAINNTTIAGINNQISQVNIKDTNVKLQIVEEKLIQNTDELNNQKALSVLGRETKLLTANKITLTNQKLSIELEELKAETNLALGDLAT
ncbi:MAG: hypothetical protein MK226_23865 [Saprospiraceae bacterium]|nr:hypothetical protein [Saprospiraceae bacterium]